MLTLSLSSNKADLRKLAEIQRQLGMKVTALQESRAADAVSSATSLLTPKRKLRAVLAAVRFVARASIAARDWRLKDETRLRIVAAAEEHIRTERRRRMLGLISR